MKDMTHYDVIVHIDRVKTALDALHYAIEGFPYDDDYLEILQDRAKDMSLNLPFIKNYVRNSELLLKGGDDEQCDS